MGEKGQQLGREEGRLGLGRGRVHQPIRASEVYPEETSRIPPTSLPDPTGCSMQSSYMAALVGWGSDKIGLTTLAAKMRDISSTGFYPGTPASFHDFVGVGQWFVHPLTCRSPKNYFCPVLAKT